MSVCACKQHSRKIKKCIQSVQQQGIGFDANAMQNKRNKGQTDSQGLWTARWLSGWPAASPRAWRPTGQHSCLPDRACCTSAARDRAKKRNNKKDHRSAGFVKGKRDEDSEAFSVDPTGIRAGGVSADDVTTHNSHPNQSTQSLAARWQHIQFIQLNALEFSGYLDDRQCIMLYNRTHSFRHCVIPPRDGVISFITSV